MSHEECDFSDTQPTPKDVIAMILVVGGIIVIGIVALIIAMALSIRYLGVVP